MSHQTHARPTDVVVVDQVWSSTSHQTHAPPTDIVMKGLVWFSGDEMKTILIDSKGEVCTIERDRERVREKE